MKKTVLLTVALCLSIIINSQNKYGIFAGLSNSTMSNGFLKGMGVDDVFGYHFGGLYEYKLNDNIAFRPKLMLSLQGDRKKGSGGSYSPTSIDYKLMYINVPLDIKFFSKPYLIMGPQIGYLVSTTKEGPDFGDIKSKFDYGLNFGLGYDINSFFIEANLYQGLQTILKGRSYTNAETNITNTVFQLSLGYYFN